MLSTIAKTTQWLNLPRLKVYQYLYHSWYKPPQFPSVEHFVSLYAKENPNAFFLQIGVNEGFSNDPIYPHIRTKNWRGILVEPLKIAFEKLVANHRNDPNLIFENVAISNSTNPMPFFYIDPSSGNLPMWVTQLSSFDPTITAQVQKVFPWARIQSTEVKCTTAHQLLHKHNVEKVDLILIDTEGYDFEILKTLNLKSLSPDVLIFEHRHLNRYDHRDAIELLWDHHYQVYKAEHDTIAFNVPSLEGMYTNTMAMESVFS